MEIMLFINYLLFVLLFFFSLIKFFCTNKNESNNKKGFPVKLGKEVLLIDVPSER